MVLFSKGMGLKNDVFCLISFLTPLDVSKTSTNIWKHLGIFQNPSEDSKNTKIGLFDQILASVKCTYPCKWGLKYQIFAYFSTFFHFFVANGPVHLWNRPSEGFWNMPTCFQMFVDVFETFKGVKNEIKQKTSFFSPIPLLKSTIS